MANDGSNGDSVRCKAVKFARTLCLHIWVLVQVVIRKVLWKQHGSLDPLDIHISHSSTQTHCSTTLHTHTLSSHSARTLSSHTQLSSHCVGFMLCNSRKPHCLRLRSRQQKAQWIETGILTRCFVAFSSQQGNYAYIPIDSGLPPFTQSREKGVFLKVGASSHKNIVFELCVLALD